MRRLWGTQVCSLVKGGPADHESPLTYESLCVLQTSLEGLRTVEEGNHGHGVILWLRRQG